MSSVWSNIICKPTLLDRGYRLVETLGYGAYGRVYRVEHVASGKTYAAKFVSDVDTVTSDNGPGTIPLEADVLIRLKDVQGVSHLHDVFFMPCGFWVMVMDIPDEPFATLATLAALGSNVDARAVMARLVHILRDVDACNVCHMDIHPSNILISADDSVTLIDFGRAQYKDQPYAHASIYAMFNDSPPELINNGVFDYDRMTTWSIGLLIHMLVDDDSAKDLLDLIFVPYDRRITLGDFFDHPYFDCSSSSPMEVDR